MDLHERRVSRWFVQDVKIYVGFNWLGIEPNLEFLQIQQIFFMFYHIWGFHSHLRLYSYIALNANVISISAGLVCKTFPAFQNI
jgi:hypothetical protein